MTDQTAQRGQKAAVEQARDYALMFGVGYVRFLSDGTCEAISPVDFPKTVERDKTALNKEKDR